jgi:hypothetical protein
VKLGLRAILDMLAMQPASDDGAPLPATSRAPRGRSARPKPRSAHRVVGRRKRSR